MLTADEVLDALRVHADRVHDAVRRLGCGPDAAVEVVEQSALDLVDAAARGDAAVGDPVGWWFARARSLARSLAGGDGALPVGGGILGGDANQVRLAEALEALPERERAALLLRDSYDLPATAVGTSLGLDATGAMEVVGAARLAFLPTLLGETAPSLAGHAVDLGALARLAEGGQLAARDATTRRHVQSCDRCAAVLDAQERARRLLSGLTVVALPDAIREGLLARVGARARDLLPEAEPEQDLEAWDDEPHRRYSLSLMALSLVLASGVGIGIGLLVSRSSDTSPVSLNANPPQLVTAAPALTLPPIATASRTGAPTVAPVPRVFFITPSPTPTPTPTVTAGATPTISAAPLTLTLDPRAGPNNTDITVTGQGWTPGATVTLQYLGRVSQTPGSTASAVVDAVGRFTTTLTAHDGQSVPGPHDVVADDGTHQGRTSFTATG